MDAISVLLVDSNPTFLRIATRLLRDHYQEHLTIVGTSPGAEDALQQAQALKPRIILLGLSQHSLIGLQLIPRLQSIVPTAGIIVLGSLDIRAYRQAATDAGADAFVSKVALNSDLLPIIQQIIGGSIPNDAANHAEEGRSLGGELPADG